MTRAEEGQEQHQHMNPPSGKHGSNEDLSLSRVTYMVKPSLRKKSPHVPLVARLPYHE